MEIFLNGHTVTIDETLLHADASTIREQVREYWNGERKRFDIRISPPAGFLGQVMEQMEHIPYGETRTYGEVADRLGTAPVAVGQACGRNPVPLIVPCHRVTASDGLGGYQYPGLKQELLEREGSI